MSDARRATRRVRLPGILVAYETATGEHHQARAMDLSREGLYVPSTKPLAVGKRLSLEIQPIGEPTAWSVLGRVVWTRDVDDGIERPAGMAIKFFDAEDTVVAAIERLLEAREPTERGLGFGGMILPAPPAQSTPPAREPVARKDLSERAPRPVLANVSEANGATAEEPKGARLSEAREDASERSLVEPAAKPRSWRAAIMFALIVAGGFLGYAFRERIRTFSHVAVSTITKHPQ